MLILPEARLVVLETPKTGSQALRKMLAAHLGRLDPSPPRHLRADLYARRWADLVERRWGAGFESLAVMRAPLERMQSWFRYRRREKLVGGGRSTGELSFARFMEGYLSDPQPEVARIGRQDRFLAWDGERLGVDHLFDYAQLPRLSAFIEARLSAARGAKRQRPLVLAQRNVSPRLEPTEDYALPLALLQRYHRQNAAEFALYEEVSKAGHWHGPAGGGAV